MGEPVEDIDARLTALADRHLNRMQEIADEGLAETKDACAQITKRIQKAVGLRDAVVDRTLEALGIQSSTGT